MEVRREGKKRGRWLCWGYVYRGIGLVEEE